MTNNSKLEDNLQLIFMLSQNKENTIWKGQYMNRPVSLYLGESFLEACLCCLLGMSCNYVHKPRPLNKVSSSYLVSSFTADFLSGHC